MSESKKRVLVVTQDMQVSGVSRAQLGLLHAFDKEKYEVDLFIRSHSGEFMSQIPEGVKLLPEIEAYRLADRTTSEAIKGGHFLLALGKAYGMMRARRYAKKHSVALSGVALDYTQRYQLPFLPKISDKEYDLVISFVAPHYFGAYKCRGKKRLCWIHTDYTSLGLDVRSEAEVWGKYDGIVAISDRVGEAFAQRFPSLEDKLTRIDNPISPELVRESSKKARAEEIVRTGEEKILLSCGRLYSVKNFRSIPHIASLMLKAGVDIKWYIIGEGGDRALIEEKIKEYGVGGRVILLGQKENPYPYMAACDLYVQPSLYEGRSVAVIEAQILGRPVAITDFPTAKGQLRDGFDGVIVPLDDEGCAEGLVRLLKDEAMLEALKKGCESSDYGCEKDIERICSYMEQTALTE